LVVGCLLFPGVSTGPRTPIVWLGFLPSQSILFRQGRNEGLWSLLPRPARPRLPRRQCGPQYSRSGPAELRKLLEERGEKGYRHLFHNFPSMFVLAEPMTPERETTAAKRGRDGSPPRYFGEPTIAGGPPPPQHPPPLFPPVAMPLLPVPPPAPLPANAALSKKTRTNNYRPPQKIPPSFTSQVGSFAVGQVMMGNNNASRTREQQQLAGRTVGLRRQLSSSKIEAFLSAGDDAMDVDAEQPGRPRSMSL
jgi:hypothetical protein